MLGRDRESDDRESGKKEEEIRNIFEYMLALSCLFFPKLKLAVRPILPSVRPTSLAAASQLAGEPNS